MYQISLFDEWRLLSATDHIEIHTDTPMPLIRTIYEPNIYTKPDKIIIGKVNGYPAEIGFKEWVSGWGSCFTEYQAILFRYL